MTDSAPREGDDQLWCIRIGGYGSFPFRGNGDDCKVLCDGKAGWEGSSGSYWRVDDIQGRLSNKKDSSARNDARRSIEALCLSAEFPDVKAICKKTRWTVGDLDLVQAALAFLTERAIVNRTTSNWTNYGRAPL